MTTAAKIICALIFLEGIIALFFPYLMKTSTEDFNKSSKAVKGRIGAITAAAGAVLIYLTRVLISEPLVHWIVAVSGIYMMLAGLCMIIFPSAAGRAAAWFYGEKKTTSLIGLTMMGGSLLLFILI